MTTAPADAPGTRAATAASAALAAALEPVRRRFIDTLETRILAVEGLRQDILRNRDADACMREVARIAHQLSGVSATLGFARVGLLAAKVERLLTSEPGRIASSDRWRAAEQPVEELLAALEAILDG